MGGSNCLVGSNPTLSASRRHVVPPARVRTGRRAVLVPPARDVEELVLLAVVRAPLDCAPEGAGQRVDAVHPGHPDVHERDVGPRRARPPPPARGPIAGLADHLDIGLRRRASRGAPRASGPGRRRSASRIMWVAIGQRATRTTQSARSSKPDVRARRRTRPTRSRMPTQAVAGAVRARAVVAGRRGRAHLDGELVAVRADCSRCVGAAWRVLRARSSRASWMIR